MQYVSGLRASDTHGLPFQLNLKLSARYMITNNINTADGLVNGATGKLLKIDYGKRSDGSSVPVRVWMMFDDAKVGAEARQKSMPLARANRIPNTWTPIEPMCHVVKRKQSGGNLQILRKQFPLLPAMAVTIHKSQGDTYNQVVVHLSPGISRSVLYVACSRAKTADGLYLVGQFKPPKKNTRQRQSVNGNGPAAGTQASHSLCRVSG
ncbi:hypothetical protein BaRGS_00006521 [Batillaria attramentaria]|uniref:UvrD-like helicase C-terminal domain-containing protein n=1 Tax=Batillaria attramentaria TaxID=370345 RepID=A0ABD0LRT3_9CAEN